MMRRLVMLIAFIAWTSFLTAQDTSVTGAGTASQIPTASPIIHWGKWVTLGAAIGFTVAAVVQHNHAQDYWNQLQRLCTTNNQACMLGSDGRYQAYEAELLYQQTIYYDHLARHRIVIGQLNLLASVGMFVLEFKRRELAPPNIPLHGLHVLIEPTGAGGVGGEGARFGFTLPF